MNLDFWNPQNALFQNLLHIAAPINTSAISALALARLISKVLETVIGDPKRLGSYWSMVSPT